jgi:glycosyltransferase involved in cell wall biosynthesis
MRGVMGDSPLNILLVTAPGKVGGLETVVASLATGLARRGHRVTVSATVPPTGEPHPFIDRLGAGGVGVSLPPEPRLAERREIIALAKKTGAGIVHSHGYRSDVLVRSARSEIRRPIVSTVHGFTGAGVKGRFYEWLQLRALRGFDRVIAVSRPLGVLLGEYGIGPGSLRVIPNGFAPAGGTLTGTEARQRLIPGSPVSGRLIGWVGRLGPEKGCDLFIKALATIRDTEWTAVIVGAGPERSSLERLARGRGLADRLLWTGSIASAAELFPAFDVFALSSRTEGTPMVVLEAMAAGVPVVATAVGGVPDLLDDGSAGWLVTPGDPAELGASLRQALDDGAEAQSRVDRARARVRDVYAVDPWLDRCEEVYRHLLAPSGSGGRT